VRPPGHVGQPALLILHTAEHHGFCETRPGRRARCHTKALTCEKPWRLLGARGEHVGPSVSIGFGGGSFGRGAHEASACTVESVGTNSFTVKGHDGTIVTVHGPLRGFPYLAKPAAFEAVPSSPMPTRKVMSKKRSRRQQPSSPEVVVLVRAASGSFLAIS
jgi:hypothetical protein